MFDDSRSFIGRPFLQSTLDYEFQDYLAVGDRHEQKRNK
jgi:hypothetical protein